ncbi:hypothetical protein [Kutzneria albida]|nr:hypothetical protein [Kutzneria albida]
MTAAADLLRRYSAEAARIMSSGAPVSQPVLLAVARHAKAVVEIYDGEQEKVRQWRATHGDGGA